MAAKAAAKRTKARPTKRQDDRPARFTRGVSEPSDPGPYTAEERATLALFSVEGIGPVTLQGLRKAFGSLAQVLREKPADVAPHLHDEATRARYLQIKDVGSLADRLFERAAKVGARVIFPERPEWPVQLQGLDFPPVLYLRGTLEPKGRRVGIVGSREADRYGNQVAGFLAAGLAERGVGVVSGGAVGVDASAHRACLEVNGPTVAVLGSGVDIAYPGDHVGLFREIIAKGGAVVSHFPPGTPSVPQNFQVRNRLIAALSEAVIVARARLGSGALQTAKAARVLKRPVFGVPGDVTCSLVAGVNQMLETREAQVCTGLAAVADALGLPGEDWPSMVEGGVKARRTRPDARSEAAGPVWAAKRRSEVPLELRPVYEAMGREPVQFDELSRKCRLDAAGLASALVRLELMGLCQERVGKVFVRT